MSKFDKFKAIFGIASGISKPFIPGSIGNVLDAVNKGIKDDKDPANIAAFTELANVNDAQTEAILILNNRIADQDARIKALEARAK